MKEPLILTFDVGTQSSRAMLVNKKGDIVAIAQEKYKEPYISEAEDFAEQTPNFYYDNMAKACQKLVKENQELINDVIAVTSTVIRDTVLCLDKDNKPLRNIIVWLDKREANPEDLPPLPGFKKFLFKLVGVEDTINMQQRQSACNWIMTKQKDLWEKTAKYVMLPTYINYLLTGVLSDSIANQIGHIPFDYKNGVWMGKGGLTRCLFDVPNEKLCEKLVQPGEILGTISKQASKVLGIKEGLPLIATGSDKGCETLGLSVISKDKAALSFGTTATIQFTTNKYFEPQPNCPSYPAVIPHYYNSEIQIYRGYWMLSWFKKEFGDKEVKEAKESGTCAEVLLNKTLETINPGCDGLMLQPFWSPGVANPNARGAIVGFKDVHTKYHLYRAIIEGINFGLMDGLYQMEKRSGQKIKELYVGGGGSQSDEILQITANMFNLPVKRIQTHEACGLGSSAIAFVTMGEFETIQDAIKAMVKDKDVFYPNEKQAKMYNVIYNNVYKKMYSRVHPLYLSMKGIEKIYE